MAGRTAELQTGFRVRGGRGGECNWRRMAKLRCCCVHALMENLIEIGDSGESCICVCIFYAAHVVNSLCRWNNFIVVRVAEPGLDFNWSGT